MVIDCGVRELGLIIIFLIIGEGRHFPDYFQVHYFNYLLYYFNAQIFHGVVKYHFVKWLQKIIVSWHLISQNVNFNWIYNERNSSGNK